MNNKMRFIWVIMMLLGVSSASLAQSGASTHDPRQMALDAYSGINRGMEPASISLKLTEIIRLFRYRCTRVTDYQVFTQRPNITDIKVKCSGDSLYGVTVASNGFVAVYGGNSILASLDRRDGVIFSFDAEGTAADSSAFDLDRIQEETKARVLLGSEYDYVYLGIMLVMLFSIVLAMGIVAFRFWRRKKKGRKPRGRMKPMNKIRIGPSSDIKDQLVAEGTEIAKFVYQHESGLIVAIGKRGKRRLFFSPFWAKLYASRNIRFNEATEKQLSEIDLNLPDLAEIVDEGDEVQIPQ
jgi:hypothetical protein